MDAALYITTERKGTSTATGSSRWRVGAGDGIPILRCKAQPTERLAGRQMWQTDHCQRSPPMLLLESPSATPRGCCIVCGAWTTSTEGSTSSSGPVPWATLPTVHTCSIHSMLSATGMRISKERHYCTVSVEYCSSQGGPRQLQV